MIGWLKRLFEVPPPRPPKFVSYYRDPRLHAPIQYLRAYPAASFCQESWDAGYEYVRELSRATRFDTYEAALAVTPQYDGSPGIERRCGVMEV